MYVEGCLNIEPNLKIIFVRLPSVAKLTDKYYFKTRFSWVQSLSHVRLFASPWTAARQASLSITNSWSPPKPMSTELVMPSSHLILYHPLLLLPSIFPSIRVFSNESALRFKWPKDWSFSFKSVLPINTQDWFPLEWTGWISLKSKGLSRVFSNITVQKHQFFDAQISSQSNSHIHTYMATGKTIALTRWTFAGKVMSLLFNMLSRLVITFLPRSKHLLISWLQSPSAVILEPPKNKVWYCFHCFPIYLPWSDVTRCHDLSFLNVEL